MPHDSGSLSVGDRLDSVEERLERVVKHAAEHGKDIQSIILTASRTQQELNGHEQHCEIKTKEVWTEFTAMKLAAKDVEAKVAAETAKVDAKVDKLALKIAMFVGIVVAVVEVGVQYAMKHL